MRLLAAMLLSLAVTPAVAGWKMDAIKNCKLDWPGHNAMVNACVEHERSARGALRKILRKKGPDADLVRACIDANPGAVQGVDYGAALVCSRIEMKRRRR